MNRVCPVARYDNNMQHPYKRNGELETDDWSDSQRTILAMTHYGYIVLDGIMQEYCSDLKGS